jgi:hydroxypyruvate isomerase
VFAHLEKAGYAGLVGYELFPETTTANAVKAIMRY